MGGKRPTILVTETEYAKARDVFAAAADVECRPAPGAERDLASAILAARAPAVIVGVEPYHGDAVYDALPRGGVLARFGVGHDGVDKTRATRRGIFVTNTPGVLTASVAEHTLWLIGALLRHVAAGDAKVRSGGWQPLIGRELRGKTLAVIGCGEIGRHVASIASHGFGIRVVGFDRPGVDVETLSSWGIRDFVTTWEDAVRKADIVSLHIASTAETRRFLNAERLAALKAGAYFVNTARGAVVDEVALYEALTAGRLAGAALDVFEAEPYVPARPDRDLRTLPNVLLTPHIGSSTVEACTRMAERALANVRAGLAKQYDLLDLVNRDAKNT